MERRERRFFVALFVACFAFLFVSLKGLVPDLDNFWQAAAGRYIVETGSVPRVNPFVIHDGFRIVLQQWAFDVVIYLLYGSFGAAGLWALSMLNAGALFLALFRFVGCFTENGRLRSFAVLIFGPFVALFQSMTRPSAWTIVAALCFACELERQRERPSPRVVLSAVAFAVFVANVQAALWPVVIVLTAPYACFDRSPRGDVRAWFSDWFGRKRYLLASIALAPLAACLNPYGVDGMLYVFRSYGAASFGGYISEMRPPEPLSVFGAALLFAVVVAVLNFRAGSWRFDVPLSLMMTGTIVLAASHLRNFWFLLFGVVPGFLALVRDSKFCSEPLPLPSARERAFFAVFISFFALVCALSASSLDFFDEADVDGVNVAAADYLDAFDGDVRLYTEFNNGGYMEWRGYDVFVDARPELYSAAVNGRADVLREWFAVYFGGRDVDCGAFLRAYDFTHLLTNSSSSLSLYVRAAGGWRPVVVGEDYYLYEKVG